MVELLACSTLLPSCSHDKATACLGSSLPVLTFEHCHADVCIIENVSSSLAESAEVLSGIKLLL